MKVFLIRFFPAMFSLLYAGVALAQEGFSKDGAVLYGIGAGYEWMPDAYSANGFALDVRARFYTSERMFCELLGHWGAHDGDKTVVQGGKPFPVHDERNCLLGAVGPGFDVFQSSGKRFCVYVKGLLGYGIRSSRYDDYRPADGGTGSVTSGCEDDKKGVAAVVGTGLDVRYRHWTLTPSVDAVYVGGKCDVAFTVSVGFFY